LRAVLDDVSHQSTAPIHGRVDIAPWIDGKLLKAISAAPRQGFCSVRAEEAHIVLARGDIQGD
jgi:hypothetical protein